MVSRDLYRFHILNGSRDRSVGTVTSLRTATEELWFDTRQGQKIFLVSKACTDHTGAYSVSCPQSGWSMKVIIEHHLLPKLRLRGAILHSPVCTMTAFSVKCKTLVVRHILLFVSQFNYIRHRLHGQNVGRGVKIRSLHRS